MKFDEAMMLPWVDGVPGNAAAMVKLYEQMNGVSEWYDFDWIGMRMVYYTLIEDAGSAWLHDIYKNRCNYNVKDTYEYLENLRGEIEFL